MRPAGAAGGDWAVVRIIGAGSDFSKRMDSTLKEIAKGDDGLLLSEINEAISHGDQGLAIALTWTSNGKASYSSQLSMVRQQSLNGCR